MNAVEGDGRIWLFGPSIEEEGVLVGDGLTILRPAGSKERDNPRKRSRSSSEGHAPYALRKWEPRDGRIDISLRASVCRYSFGC
jgi:hypothetical protein